MTQAEAKARANAVGCTFSKKDGEYRVNLRGYPEATAYYTNELHDAVATAEEMGRRRNAAIVEAALLGGYAR